MARWLAWPAFLLPAGAWLSQLLYRPVMAQAPPEVNALVAVVQYGMLFAGLGLGGASLAIGKARPGTGRWAAFAGLAISAGTLGYIAGLLLRKH